MNAPTFFLTPEHHNRLALRLQISTDIENGLRAIDNSGEEIIQFIQ